MKFVEFKEEIQKAYAKRFPQSACEVKILKYLGRMISIDCYMAGDKSEFLFGYASNDMFSVGMSINLPDDFGNDDDLPEKLVLQWNSSFINIKPEENWCAYDAEDVSCRKTTGDAKKIIKTLDKYFQRLFDTTKNLMEEDRIHQNYAELVSKKVR